MTAPAVLVAGGGTGGHVVPSLAVGAALRAGGLEVCFVGTERGLESRLVPEAGFPLVTVEVLPLVRRLTPGTARVPPALWRATAEVVRLIRRRRVAAAVVFGGYVSLPLALAAWRTGTPYVVHEQNAVPGLANRLAARRAAAVAVTFPSSVRRFGRLRAPVEVTGNPTRPDLAPDPDPLQRHARRAEAMDVFGLEPHRRTLLVFGGSQGARRINTAIASSLVLWGQGDRAGAAGTSRLQILHATGRANAAEAQAAWRAARAAAPAGAVLPHVRVVEFLDRMDLAYAATDVVVSRAGASTIAELTVLGLPAVLVPYPHATADHQTANAAGLAAAGGAVVVTDADLDATALVAAARPLLDDDELRARTAAAARAFARPDAARRVADLVRRVAGLPGGTAPTRPPSSVPGEPGAQP